MYFLHLQPSNIWDTVISASYTLVRKDYLGRVYVLQMSTPGASHSHNIAALALHVSLLYTACLSSIFLTLLYSRLRCAKRGIF